MSLCVKRNNIPEIVNLIDTLRCQSKHRTLWKETKKGVSQDLPYHGPFKHTLYIDFYMSSCILCALRCQQSQNTYLGVFLLRLPVT